MDQLPKRLTGAVFSWTAVVAMALIKTFLDYDGLVIWAMLACCTALVCTGWLIAEHVVERAIGGALRHLAEQDEQQLTQVAGRLADALAESRGNVSRLR